jgi:hypothetical protein
MTTYQPAGNVPAYDGKNKLLVNSQPGGSTASVPTGAGNTVVSAAAGRLASVIVTTASTGAAVFIYDNATTNSGTIIGALPASVAVGRYPFDVPAANGITVANVLNGPVCTVVYD